MIILDRWPGDDFSGEEKIPHGDEKEKPGS